MPSERQYHVNNGPAAAIVASRERLPAMPGTPSRKERQRETSALQDPGLKDYVRRHPQTPFDLRTRADVCV